MNKPCKNGLRKKPRFFQKAQGLPMNTIIIAVILLLLLVVVIYIFSAKGIGPFSRGLGDCVNKGGSCKVSCSKDEASVSTGCYDESGEFQDMYFCCVPFS